MVQCNSDSKLILNRLKDFLAWLDSELSANAEISGEAGSSQRIFFYVFPTKRKKIMKILGKLLFSVSSVPLMFTVFIFYCLLRMCNY